MARTMRLTPCPRVPQAAPRLMFARVFAQHFEAKPNGLQAGPIVRASPRFAAVRSAVTASVLEDFQLAREVALKVGGVLGFQGLVEVGGA